MQAPVEPGATSLMLVSSGRDASRPDEVQLNPFGELTLALAWVALVAINLWTWRTILRRRSSPGVRPGSGATPPGPE
jgi:hypothetical protein